MNKLTIVSVLVTSLLFAGNGRAQTDQVPPQPSAYQLKMEFGEAGLLISGGYPHDLLGIVIGTEKVEFKLPGDALLSLKPELFLFLGEFDAYGEYLIGVPGVPTRPQVPTSIFGQAISTVLDSTFFATSNVLLLASSGDK